jgi:hypothetical protein
MPDTTSPSWGDPLLLKELLEMVIRGDGGIPTRGVISPAYLFTGGVIGPISLNNVLSAGMGEAPVKSVFVPYLLMVLPDHRPSEAPADRRPR